MKVDDVERRLVAKLAVGVEETVVRPWCGYVFEVPEPRRSRSFGFHSAVAQSDRYGSGSNPSHVLQKQVQAEWRV
ncbi:hypothetical protein CASFOL_034269 [Castilleja foliolosa]|uniref:Uncharacterized protein n=1 Tax=Castilleja foliolosa TaxID=1961234 RepID=A0ABD3BX53_9LAMI